MIGCQRSRQSCPCFSSTFSCFISIIRFTGIKPTDKDRTSLILTPSQIGSIPSCHNHKRIQNLS
jgi:hypothetical protein